MVRVAGLYSQIKQEVDSLSSDGLTPEEQMDEVVLETKNLLLLLKRIRLTQAYFRGRSVLTGTCC